MIEILTMVMDTFVSSVLSIASWGWIQFLLALLGLIAIAGILWWFGMTASNRAAEWLQSMSMFGTVVVFIIAIALLAFYLFANDMENAINLWEMIR